ncbi:MAG: ribosome small subunit-dependent GTPase A [Candidatus Krumholzibacteriota bacterium]
MPCGGPPRRCEIEVHDGNGTGSGSPAAHDGTREGIVIRATSGRCLVAASGLVWSCKVRGRLKKGPRQVQTVAVVGDRVRFLALDSDSENPTGVIEEVLPRRNRISRLAARRSGGRTEQVLMANLDQVVAVQSLREPAPQSGFVDRLLVAAERFGVQGVLVLNKCDLISDPAEHAEELEKGDYFAGLDYRVIRTSATTGQGVKEFQDVLTDRISLLIGASGVGKSTLLNAIQPGLELRVNEVTEKTGLGRHTTTRTELFPLENGGFIADSPGIRGFDPWDIDPEQVRDYFPDFAEGGAECRFRTCLHRDEPQCGIKARVAQGVIPAWRHEAYLALLGDLEERKASRGYRG